MPLFFIFLFSLLIINYSLFIPPAAAQCPVCIVTVGGGMLIAQKLGIDDLLVSIWISALNTAISYYLAPKLKIKFLRSPILFSALMYAMTLAYFQFTDQLGVVSNRILGIDKILFGMTLGLLSIVAGHALYLYSKKRNRNKALFPYSKVVIPVSLVLIVTLIFKFAFSL